MWQVSQTNIVRERLVDVSAENFTDENGFFIRCGGAGNISYVPMEIGRASCRERV